MIIGVITCQLAQFQQMSGEINRVATNETVIQIEEINDTKNYMF